METAALTTLNAVKSPWTLSNFYVRGTRKAIREFQKSQGLKVTG